MNNGISYMRLMRMSQEEVERYYRQMRSKRFENHKKIEGIEWRKKIHKLFLMFVKVAGYLDGQRLTIINDREKKTNNSVVYVCTHIGRYDIEMALRLCAENSWLFMGDPRGVYRSFDGFLLFLNGIVYADTAYKEDRYIGKETCIDILNQKGNILIYPEGAWNITENQIVMKLYTGAAEMAIRSGAEIVPIAIEQDGKHYYGNKGENIVCSKYDLSQKHQLTTRIRDELATLKWEIWENIGVQKRSSLSENESEKFLQKIMEQTENGYTIEEIKRTRFHDKMDIEQQQVFEYLDKLIPCKENAFLFRTSMNYRNK